VLALYVSRAVSAVADYCFSRLLLLQVQDQAKRDELSGLFGLSDEDKADIASRSDSRAEKMRQEQEEEAFFL
jgi:hypothetical protein